MSDPIRTALAELVELKKLHDKSEGFLPLDPANLARKQRAWAAARAALAEQPSVREPLTDEQIKNALVISDDYWATSKLWIIGVWRAAEAAHGIGVKEGA